MHHILSLLPQIFPRTYCNHKDVKAEELNTGWLDRWMDGWRERTSVLGAAL